MNLLNRKTVSFFSAPLLAAVALTLGTVFATANYNLPFDVTPERALTFKTAGGEDLKIDLFLPVEAKKLLPVVVYFHTGQFRKGDRGEFERMKFFPQIWIPMVEAKQLAVAAVDVRDTDGSTPLEAIAGDARDAIRWLRANAAKYGLDGDRIATTGYGSGGLLALLSGLAPDALIPGDPALAMTSGDVSFIISFSAPMDFIRHAEVFGKDEDDLKDVEKTTLTHLFGGLIEEKKDAYQRLSPVTLLTKNSPPVLAVGGTKDEHYAHVEWLKEAGERVGAKVTPLPVEGARQQVYRYFSGQKPSQDALQEMIREFTLKQFDAGS